MSVLTILGYFFGKQCLSYALLWKVHKTHTIKEGSRCPALVALASSSPDLPAAGPVLTPNLPAGSSLPAPSSFFAMLAPSELSGCPREDFLVPPTTTT